MKLAVDFSLRCYIFCDCNSVRICQNIQNETLLERSICFDVVAYQFINLNWKLNGSRKENMHHSIWNENNQISHQRVNTKSIVNLDCSALHSSNQERNLHGLYRHGILLKDPDKQQCLLYASTSLQNLCLKITFVLNMLPLLFWPFHLIFR